MYGWLALIAAIIVVAGVLYLGITGYQDYKVVKQWKESKDSDEPW